MLRPRTTRTPGGVPLFRTPRGNRPGGGSSRCRRWRRPRPAEQPPAQLEPTDIALSPDDPVLSYLVGIAGPVAVDRIPLESPGVQALREAGISLVVPLVTSGELVGLLSLGPRRSEREYSTDDRRLLQDLATHAAPAVRVAQLVREQESEALARQRIEQELHVARLIQQQFLPKELPDLPGWHVAAHYQPAREVGGDFYDFLELPDGQLGVVIGDVTDKGVPAALVMATTHSILRAEAARLVVPGGRPAAGQRAPHRGDAPAHVRHLPVRRPRPRQRPAALRQRRPRPAVPAHGRGRRRAAGDRDAAGPAARHGVRGEGGRPRTRPGGAAAQRRRGRGARSRTGRCSASRGSSGSSPSRSPAGS